MFFEKRVFQGSSGRVYPLPFVDKVHDQPEPRDYQLIALENDFLYLELMPEIGGRIFKAMDKKNAGYDFFYRQDVIKPALVGLAGPWISGGVEFNWPQHHRPSTFMPTDYFIEEEADGARTVWMSEIDPLARMKGMHGVRIRPGSSLLELRVRLFNRTPLTQTFLWWANVCALVHDNYQSFFPEDVHYVADHAVRAMSGFPVSQDNYYGVPYGERPGRNDLRWYKNIPVPTSYMVCETGFDFFGGYDFDANGGFVHVANRHIAPGKKQWTWGDNEFGWAWDRELTDENGPYVELMAGVYTDNQPDFTYLLPLETKTFSQFWWPYQKLGPVQNANKEVAVKLEVDDERVIHWGVAASSALNGIRLLIQDNGNTLLDVRRDVSPDQPLMDQITGWRGDESDSLSIKVLDDKEKILISYRPAPRSAVEAPRNRQKATEPPLPSAIEEIDVLYLTGEHLEQYRHPTRSPEPYWEEALRRDPGDSRCHLAMGRRLLGRGLLSAAQDHLQKAVQRLTHRHPNPCTGEAHYFLGLCQRYQENHTQAYAAFYKATWNYEWRASAFYEIACLDSLRGDWEEAFLHIKEALRVNADNSKAKILAALLHLEAGRDAEAIEQIDKLLAEDPLDHWALHVRASQGGDMDAFLSTCRNDAQTILDIALDYLQCGFAGRALELLQLHHAKAVPEAPVPNPQNRSLSTRYLEGYTWERMGKGSEAEALLGDAAGRSLRYYFPSRIEEELLLRWVLDRNGNDINAAYGLGNLLYDKRRHDEAIGVWQAALSVKEDAAVLRNLAIAMWNTRWDGDAAFTMYEKAVTLDPEDGRMAYEFDQLRKKINHSPADRLQWMESRRNLIAERDDASVELAALYNLNGKAEIAYELLSQRTFHPWEGGEGKVLQQWRVCCIQLGRQALENGDPTGATQWFSKVLETPDNLGEKYHLLQARADIYYWLGMAAKGAGDKQLAQERFQRSAGESGDFRDMAVTAHSEMTWYRAESLRELGREEEALALFNELLQHANRLAEKEANIEYFATSLPRLLVFEEDIQKMQQAESHLLVAYARRGKGQDEAAAKALDAARQINRSDMRLQEFS